MTRSQIGFLALIALFFIVFFGVSSRHGESAALRAARDSVAVAVQGAHRADDFAALQTARASAAERRADSASARADSIARATVPKRVRAAQLAAVAPDTCRPALDAAQDVIDSQQAELVDRSQSLVEARSALADTRTALDSVRAANGRLGAAATVLVGASRPSLLSRLAPRLGVGVAAGIDPFTHRLSTTAGLTLGWSF